MKPREALFVLVAGLLLGCNSGEPPPSGTTNSSSRGHPLAAPADYLGAAARARKSASKTILDAGLEQAIQLFHAEQGRFPNDLKELVPQYLSSIPHAPLGVKYHYDPKTGTVEVAAE